jgi:hypothetical protein
VQVWLYYFLNPFYAYSLNLFILHFVAFIGARLLIKKNILPWLVPNKEEHFNYNFLVDGSALYFALLPHWPLGGLSIAGMPLLLYSFLNFYKKINSKWDWFVIITYPFYSSFYFSNMYFILILLIIFIYGLLSSKKFNKILILTIIIFIVLGIFTEYRLFLSIIDGFDSQRLSNNLNYSNITSNMFSLYKLIYNYELLIKSYIESPIKIFPFVLLSLFLSISILYIKNENKLLKIIIAMIIFIICISYGKYLKSYLLSFFSFFPLLKKLLSSITFRPFVLNPLLWLILFSASIISIYHQSACKLPSIFIFKLVINANY